MENPRGGGLALKKSISDNPTPPDAPTNEGVGEALRFGLTPPLNTSIFLLNIKGIYRTPAEPDPKQVPVQHLTVFRASNQHLFYSVESFFRPYPDLPS